MFLVPSQKVYETLFAGRPCVVKERVKKSYRLPVLDKKLSHRRLVQEARCIVKCRKAGVVTPCIYLIDEERGRLYTEKICGGSVKEYLRHAFSKEGASGSIYSTLTRAARLTRSCMYMCCVYVLCVDGTYAPAATKLAYQIGVAIARMHDADIVHGDLTTSNMMLRSEDATEVVRCVCIGMVGIVAMFSCIAC